MSRRVWERERQQNLKLKLNEMFLTEAKIKRVERTKPGKNLVS